MPVVRLKRKGSAVILRLEVHIGSRIKRQFLESSLKQTREGSAKSKIQYGDWRLREGAGLEIRTPSTLYPISHRQKRVTPESGCTKLEYLSICGHPLL